MLFYYFLHFLLALLCALEIIIITYKRLKFNPVTAKCISIKRTLTGTSLTYRYEDNSNSYIRTEKICSFVSSKIKDNDLTLYVNPKNEKSFISEKRFKMLFIFNFILSLLSLLVALSPFIGIN